MESFETVKKVELLATLKGTVEGKQSIWLRGTVFDKEVRPFPPNIIVEYKSRPRLFKVLEVYPKVVADMEQIKKVVKEVQETATKPEEEQESTEKATPKPKIMRAKVT